MLQVLFPYRFPIFFMSLIAILFGSLVVPEVIFESIVSPLFFILNILTGMVLLSKKEKVKWIVFVIMLIVLACYFLEYFRDEASFALDLIKMISFFVFYVIVTMELIWQILKSKKIGINEIYGLISGYICLGLIGIFICLTIESWHPNSFSGMDPNMSLSENFMYFSYITLITIGYGDMAPITTLAKKASVLIALVGQIYLVVITAMIVGKYVNQNSDGLNP